MAEVSFYFFEARAKVEQRIPSAGDKSHCSYEVSVLLTRVGAAIDEYIIGIDGWQLAQIFLPMNTTVLTAPFGHAE